MIEDAGIKPVKKCSIVDAYSDTVQVSDTRDDAIKNQSRLPNFTSHRQQRLQQKHLYQIDHCALNQALQ